MAKHAKKNNIISYDEAKQKKLQEREAQNHRNAKHFKEDYSRTDDFFEEVNNDSYFDDAQNSESEYNFSDYRDYDEEKQPDEYYDDYAEESRPRFERRGGKYAEEKPQLPRALVNTIIVAMMTLVLAAMLIMLFKTYVVESINVTGNDSVKYHDITQLCGVDYKQSMFSVKKEDIVESFESQMPMIEVVEVSKVWPNILNIAVKERPPICYVVLKGSQKCALIGENNVCLSIVDSYLEGDLPRIYGLDIGSGELGKELVDGEARKLEVLKLLIVAMQETDCISDLKSINIKNTTNITMESVDGTIIKMGDTSNINKKLSNIKVMLQHLRSQGNTDVTMVVTGDNAIYIED